MIVPAQMSIVCTIYAGGESTNFLIKLPYVNGMLYNLYAMVQWRLQDFFLGESIMTEPRICWCGIDE